MDASDQTQPEQGDQNDGSQDAGQEQGAQVSQETPTEDSALQTPQADQPVPTENERDGQPQETQPPAEAAVQQDESAGEAPTKPRFDQPEDSGPVSSGDPQDPVQREQELEDARRESNERTGGGEIQENEVQNARQEHNDRTGGGEVPGADSGESSDSGDSAQ